MNTFEETEPTWHEGVTMPSFPPLAESLHVQAVIVGGGIKGLTAILQKRAELYRPSRRPTLRQLLYKGRDYSEELFRGVVATAFRSRKK